MAATIKVNFVGDTKNLDTAVTNSQTLLRNFKNTAKVGALAIAGGVAAGVTASVRSWTEFDEAFTEATSQFDDLTPDQLERMRDAVRDLGKTTRFSTAEAATGFYALGGAGLNAEEAIAALPAVADFAQASLLDVSDAAALLNRAQSALGLSSDDAAEHLTNLVHVSDSLVVTSKNAGATVEELTESLTSGAAATARQLGIPLEQVLGTLGVMADLGKVGSKAGNAVVRMLDDLTTKAKENSQAFDDAGIAVFDAGGQFTSTAAIIEDFEEAFVGLSDEQKKGLLLDLGVTGEAQKAILDLVGSADELAEANARIRDEAAGATGGVVDKQLDSTAAKWDLLKGKIEDLALTIGEKLAPTIERVIGFLDGLTTAISEDGFGGAIDFLNEKSTLIVPILAGLATVLGVALVVGIGLLIAAMSPLVLTIAGITLAAGVLAAGFVYLYQENDTFRGIVDKVVDALGWLWDKFNYIVDAIVDWLASLASLGTPMELAGLLFTKFKDTVVNAFTIAYNWVKEKIDWIVRKVKGIGAAIGGGAATAFNGIKTAMTGAWKFVKGKIDQVIALPGTIWRKVKKLIGTGAFQGVKDSINSAVSWVAGKIDNIIAAPGRIWGRVKALIGTGAFQGVKDSITSAWTFVTGKITAVINTVKGIKGRVTGGVGNAFNGIKTAIKSAYDDVKTKIDLVVGKITGLKRRVTLAAAGLFDGIKGAFKQAINFLIGKWNDFKLTIRVPGTSWSYSLNTPDIPKLAHGGLVKDPTLAVVGDSPGESEIVSPVSTMRNIVREELGNTGGGRGDINIGTINMNTNADISDLSHELRWLQVTQGAS